MKPHVNRVELFYNELYSNEQFLRVHQAQQVTRWELCHAIAGRVAHQVWRHLRENHDSYLYLCGSALLDHTSEHNFDLPRPNATSAYVIIRGFYDRGMWLEVAYVCVVQITSFSVVC